MTDDRNMALFFELYSGLPRQGPGDCDSTRRAFSLVPPLGPSARILDIGCGTGTQTLESGQVLRGGHRGGGRPSTLRRGTQQEGGAARRRRPSDCPRRRHDLSRPAGEALRPGLVGRRDLQHGLRRGSRGVADPAPAGRPSRRVRAMLARARSASGMPGVLHVRYPAIRGIAANRAAVARCGYALVGDFCLPSSAWWRNYYDPLLSNIASFKARHAGDPAADAIAGQSEREIGMYRKYADYCGYVFFVMRESGT